MARPSQQSINDAMEAVRQCGVNTISDQDQLEDVLLAVRGRVRSQEANGTAEQQRQGLTRCLRPIWHYVMSQADLASLPVDTQHDLVWNLYATSVARTASAESFPLITKDLQAWHEVVQSLMNAEQVVQPVNGKEAVIPRFWYVGILGLVCLAAEGWMPDGRTRFYAMVAGLGSILVAWIMWYFGDSTALDSLQSANARRPAYLDAFDTGATGGADASNGLPPLEAIPMPAPATAPPLPTGGGLTIGEGAHTTTAEAVPVGTSVEFLPVHPFTVLGGHRGTVTGVSSKGLDVRLESGLEVGGVQAHAFVVKKDDKALHEAQTMQIPSSSGEFYAPFTATSTSTKTQEQAKRVREALERSSALQATTPSWPTLFWQAVKNEVDLYGLTDEIRRVLTVNGYHGPSTIGAPRTDELKKALAELEVAGLPQHGAGGAMLRASNDGGIGGTDPETMSWHLKLPPDLQRAAPELYRNIRAEGVSSVRQWVNDQHPAMEQRQGAAYQDLFTAATIIDFELAGCQDESVLMHRLATSDTLEIQLRKLGSFIYLRRTKDRAGAARMLGIRAPGTMSDIAPKWMLDDANSFSKIEWQRTERGHKQSRSEPSHGGGQSKYAGKFRGRGRGGGGKGGGKGRGGQNTTQG